jgi:uncharacterized protein YbjT (DUF2867 family)
VVADIPYISTGTYCSIGGSRHQTTLLDFSRKKGQRVLTSHLPHFVYNHNTRYFSVSTIAIMSKDKQSVLVILATGKAGSGIVDAFLASGKYEVFGTSRDGANASLLKKGVTPIEFKFGDKESMVAALNTSKASVCVIITDFVGPAKGSRATEVWQGQVMIDACKEQVGVKHVIFMSVTCADVAPENVASFKSKYDIEEYLKSSGLACYSILRPASFFENYHDPGAHRPLVRGKLTSVYPADLPLPWIATIDIGKAAVAMANDPARWEEKTLVCVSCISTGADNMAALSDASGVVPCKYTMVPRILLWLLMRPLYYLVCFLLTPNKNILDEDAVSAFHDVVPDALGPKEFFLSVGKCSDGTKFGQDPPSSPPIWKSPVVMSSAVIVVAVATRSKDR